jgi:hypothetical protein
VFEEANVGAAGTAKSLVLLQRAGLRFSFAWELTSAIQVVQAGFNRQLIVDCAQLMAFFGNEGRSIITDAPPESIRHLCEMASDEHGLSGSEVLASLNSLLLKRRSFENTKWAMLESEVVRSANEQVKIPSPLMSSTDHHDVTHYLKSSDSHLFARALEKPVLSRGEIDRLFVEGNAGNSVISFTQPAPTDFLIPTMNVSGSLTLAYLECFDLIDKRFDSFDGLVAALKVLTCHRPSPIINPFIFVWLC